MTQPRRKTPRKSQHHNDTRVHFEHTLSRGPANPPRTLASFLMTMKIEAKVQLGQQTSTGGTNLTGTQLSAMLPGGAVIWDRWRILKIEVWGADYQSGGPTVPDVNLTINATNMMTETAVFTDTGTAGSQRAHISVRPSTLYQQSWRSTAPDSAVYLTIGSTTLTGTTPSAITVLHVTFEARTKPLAKPAFGP